MLRLVVVGALGVLMWACSGDEGPQSLADALGEPELTDLEAMYAFQAHFTEQIEELIVACMAEQGFDYAATGIAEDPRAGGEMTAAHYRERYGILRSMANQSHGIHRQAIRPGR